MLPRGSMAKASILIVRTRELNFFFFLGTLFLRKLYLKNFNIQNKNNKISQGNLFFLQLNCKEICVGAMARVQGRRLPMLSLSGF